MRVTTNGTYLAMSANLGTALSRVSDVQNKLGSGKQIQSWSDDTPAATAASRYRAEDAEWASYEKVALDAKGWLGSADGTLQSMTSLLTRVNQLAVGAVNGSASADGRQAAASEIEQLRAELVDLGNTRYLGRPLFGGFSSDRALSESGGTISYVGDDGQVRRQVTPTIALTVNVTAKSLFGLGSGQDVFTTLQKLADAARSGDTAALASGQNALQAAQASVLKGLAQIGATTNRVDAASQANSMAREDLQARRSELEDVDVASAVLQLQAAQAGYQAALGAASRANLPSLADFLK